MRTAAIVTVGTELVEGLRVDTNTSTVARALAGCGFTVAEAVSVGDDADTLAGTLSRLTARYELVVTTGGLGPTHDDITREAAAKALGAPLARDPRLEAKLRAIASRLVDSAAAEQVYSQADVITGATVIDAVTGTAPGLLAPTPLGLLALLPGPPREMQPMLAELTARFGDSRPAVPELGVVGLSESDVQMRCQQVLAGFPGIRLTVLAKPGDVRVILLAEGADQSSLTVAANSIASNLGDHCYAKDGSTLAQVLVRDAVDAGVTFGFAESCTGGLASGAVTDVPGASDAFLGGVIAYDNRVKTELLDVPPGLLAQFGAVSEQTARAMAEGARGRLGCDLAGAVTGIAGPAGETPDKPVGLVWFAICGPDGCTALERRFPASSGRAAIRERSVATLLDLMRRHLRTR